MINDIDLKATIKTSDKRIEIHFEITNSKPVDIYVTDFSVVVRPEGPKLRRDHLRVSFDPPDTAVLSSYLSALPENTTWVTPPVAYTTKVASGDTYRNIVSAARPLRTPDAKPRFGPEGEPITEGEHEIVCNKVRFELGVIIHSPELYSRQFNLLDMDIHELNMAAWKHQVVISVEADKINVPVIVRK